MNWTNRFMVLTGIGFEKDPSLVLEDEPGARALGLQAAELNELLVEAREIGPRLPEKVGA